MAVELSREAAVEIRLWTFNQSLLTCTVDLNFHTVQMLLLPMLPLLMLLYLLLPCFAHNRSTLLLQMLLLLILLLLMLLLLMMILGC